MTQLIAKETDFEYLQPKETTDAQLDGIAGGIVDLLDNPDPNFSAEAVSREATEEEKAPPKQEDEETPPTPPAKAEEAKTEKPSEEPDKYTIKWQGQEKEVTQDELINLAQQGFDYTQKTQTLAQERDQLAPYVGLAKQIQSNPVLAQQIAAILAGTATPQQPQKKQFDDPIEQLKWETKQEALAEIRQEFQQAIVPMQRQQALNAVKAEVQRDPEYTVVHQAIIDMVASQPPAIQKTLYLQLDQDPQAYMEAFQHFKKQKATVVTEPENKAATKIVKKETKAPILDAGGVASNEAVVSKEKTQRLSKQKASALRSGDPLAIAAWLQDSGAIDHLY